ncbi:uncharacterized protein LOC116436477 [Corvus moneduloides]|uniref:uncharacterized protein LOC116436477 n=1 Tax=Corvus moneduloides TaxID=1196302 RepID=UPI0013647CF7|nr:uncharacterized protein LOC116436477 [Corvus moneduloides]
MSVRIPGGPQGIPVDPTRSQRVPPAPSGSQRIPVGPSRSQQVPAAPRGSGRSSGGEGPRTPPGPGPAPPRAFVRARPGPIPMETRPGGKGGRRRQRSGGGTGAPPGPAGPGAPPSSRTPVLLRGTPGKKRRERNAGEETPGSSEGTDGKAPESSEPSGEEDAVLMMLREMQQ